MAIRDIYHDADTIRRHRQSGHWADRTLDDDLQRHARERGDKLAIIDRRWRLTFAELDRLAAEAAKLEKQFETFRLAGRDAETSECHWAETLTRVFWM